MCVFITKAKFDEKSMWLTLSDERMLGIPLNGFPILKRATLQQLADYEITPLGIYWDGLNENLSLAELLSTAPISQYAPRDKT